MVIRNERMDLMCIFEERHCGTWTKKAVEIHQTAEEQVEVAMGKGTHVLHISLFTSGTKRTIRTRGEGKTGRWREGKDKGRTDRQEGGRKDWVHASAAGPKRNKKRDVVMGGGPAGSHTHAH